LEYLDWSSSQPWPIIEIIIVTPLFLVLFEFHLRLDVVFALLIA